MESPRWTVAATIGVALVGVSACSLAVVWGSSWGGAEDAVSAAMSDHLGAEAALVGEHLRDVPVDLLARLGPGHASDVVTARLERLRHASGLHDAALLGPSGVVVGSDGTWLPGAAESDLVARARAGERVAGALYRARDGALYLTAYAPLAGQDGWVVAVEGSATLGAVDRLARRQAGASAGVLAGVAVLAVVLAAGISRPLRALELALQSVRPGDAPTNVPQAGPREVWRVASAARGLLSAILERDRAVERAHREQVQQLVRLSAEVAHEIRNPLNAMSLSVDRLARSDDPPLRAKLAARLTEQIGELDAIASRLMGLSRPVSERRPVDLAALATTLATEVGVAPVVRGGVVVALDPTFAAEIVRNLLLNAREAGASRVAVRIDAETLEVEDDGSGIDDVEPLFDWFHTSRAQGSGLGLPIARRMAEGMGGGLVCVRGRPATFRWTFGEVR